jgi:hypothetical protein
MRWMFVDPRDSAEVALREQKLRQIDVWWQEFARQAPRLSDLFSQRTAWDLPAWMHEHLGAIDPRLMWEYGPAISGDGHRLVITPEAERWLRPLVATLLQRAPRLTGWEFYSYRLPESVEMARASVEARTEADLTETVVEARIGPAHRIELVFRSPHCTGPEDDAAHSAAFVATETLLGEETLDCWVGNIEVGPLSAGGWLSKLRGSGSAGSRAIGLDRLRPTAESLIGSIVEQLPPEPRHAQVDEATWATVQLQPEEQADYVERTDLLVAVTGCLEMWKGAHGGGIFHSGRYSRHGETFCYLKIDGKDGLAHTRFEDRGDIEDTLNDALIPAAAGCVVGGGTGLRYSYIDLALTDVARAAQIMRDLFASSGIPRRTWLQFLDDDLAHEWIGMTDGTPPPPM